MLPPEEAIDAVQRLMETFPNGGVVIGGVAVGLHSPPRATADVDAVTTFPLDRLDEFLAAAVAQGFRLRRPDGEAFARKNLVLLLVHETTGVSVDVSFGYLPFEREVVERRVEKRLGSVRV